MKKRFLEIIKNQLISFLVYIVFFTILGFWGQHFFLFDIFSQFRLQYFISGTIILLCLLFLKTLIKTEKWALYLCLFIVIVNFLQVVPYIKLKRPASITSPEDIKIELMNVLTSNDGYKAVLDNIKEVKPNIIFLEEVNSEWLNKMSSLDKIYPYSIKLSREDNFGVAIYSNIPLKTKDIKLLGTYNLPVIICTIVTKNGQLKIIGLHTTPPGNPDYFKNREEMIDDVTKIIKADKTPTVLIGDLNMTMYAPSFKKFIKESKLENPRRTFGITPSWSPKTREIGKINFDKLYKAMLIPIDHLLNSKNVNVTSFKIGKPIGSDHLPVMVNIEN